MAAFLASLILTAAMCIVILAVGRRRAPGTPLTWGEAFLAATFVFGLLFMIYGVVPDRWLNWADNELGWRKDAFGIPNPFGKSWLEDGIAFGGRGRVMISKEAVRDVIAAGIYVVGLGAQIMGWLWWQRRGQRPATAEVEKSAYGRPLIRKV